MNEIIAKISIFSAHPCTRTLQVHMALLLQGICEIVVFENHQVILNNHQMPNLRIIIAIVKNHYSDF